MLPNANDLTVEEVAAMTRQKPETLQAALRRGQLRGYKVGASWRVTRAALADYCREWQAATPAGRKRRRKPGRMAERDAAAERRLRAAGLLT